MSSAESSSWTVPFDAMRTRSDMASTPTKRPARPTGRLVTDVPNVRALRPRLARIKVGRHLNVGIAGLGVRCRRCRLGQRAHERLDLAERHAAELYVLTGGPRGNIVDLLDKVGCERGLAISNGAHGKRICGPGAEQREDGDSSTRDRPVHCCKPH